MELGQRIRQARLERGMSQRQLCGEEITRNMLSLIENGSARPSMDTLCYFAQRLEKPVSWFLDEETVSPNQACMAAARAHYLQGEYPRALEMLEAFQRPDGVFESEYCLLYALCAMGWAEQVLAEGKAVYAAELLEKAQSTGGASPYFTEALQRQWLLLMGKTGQTPAETLVTRLPSLGQELQLRAEAALAAGDAAACVALLDAASEKDSRWQLLRGKGAAALGAYQEAVACFHRAEADYPRECARALEVCYRELENYKMAYLYACKQREA